jgi:hypothetical protein
VARWNGSSWNLVPSAATAAHDTILRSVAGPHEGDVWAVGQSRSADGSTVTTLVEHWDGRTWKVVGSPSPTQQSWFTGVAVRGSAVWAVGVRVDGFTNHTLMVRGEEGRFSTVPSSSRGSGDNGLEGVAISDGSAWAVGSDQGQTKGESLVLAVCPE